MILYSIFSNKTEVKNNAGIIFLAGLIAIIWGYNIDSKKPHDNVSKAYVSNSYRSSYTSREDAGYNWAEENNITEFSDCQYEFGSSEEEDGCNKYVRENKYDGYLSFHGYDCSEDCSGHEAGYEWAEDNNIRDEYDCDGNSDSFIEGCRIYVQENY